MTDHDAAHAGIRKHRWTRRFRAAGWSLAAALVLTIGVRTAVAQVYVVPTASIEPEIPQD
ncbi:MAG: S26 family signal peptidase, partial [Phycisphaerales bacterium]|nr:S26 family signal peptidase [Phycisphaerales bacterium]